MTPDPGAITGSADNDANGADAIDLRFRADPGLAPLLDAARTALSQAWDRGESPHRLLVNRPVHRLLSRIREPELERGAELVVLGLVVDTAQVSATGTQEPRQPPSQPDW